ncbi:flagellar hook protein [Pseudoroseomonas deserti]|uniref:Flagellin n=1 Tax=Teichococcus deserti TaxID=1817963 RepID=A0A1V2GXL5_9PROT|nr:flagellin [Pseudoroseomonas deserti]ONG48356.1 flagellar hook protein [Pseudoroseomonas deserti]
MSDRVSPSGIALGRQAGLMRMQSDLAVLTAEMSSGRKADPARSLGVGASLLYKLYGDVQQGEAIKNATSLAGERLKTMQTAMTSIGDLMDQMSPEILKVDQLKDNGYTIIASHAKEVLGSLTDLLNAHWDGQNIFGGTDTSKPPVADSAALAAWASGQLTTAVTAAGAPLDATQTTTMLAGFDAMFANVQRDATGTTSFYGLVYVSTSRTAMNGSTDPESDANSLVRIGAGETLSYNVRADNDTFKNAYEALSMLTLLDAPDTSLSEEARTAILDKAGDLMRTARAQLTVVAGVLGTKQQRLQNVADIQDRAVSAATAQINDLEASDYYTVSDRISQLQLQLQATYSITARLADLSFVNYL